MCQHAEVACFFVSGDTEYKQKESPYTQPETKQNKTKKQTTTTTTKKKKRGSRRGKKEIEKPFAFLSL